MNYKLITFSDYALLGNIARKAHLLTAGGLDFEARPRATKDALDALNTTKRIKMTVRLSTTTNLASLRKLNRQ